MRERDMTDRERDEIERVIATWRERVETHTARAIAATDVTNFDRQDSAAYATRLCADDLEAVLRRSRTVPPSLRELLVRADSYLSLLWYRHTPPNIKADSELRYDVERTIGEQREASKGEAAESRAVPPLNELVTCSLRDPDQVVHLPRLDCQHEAPHLIAACGAFKGEAAETRAKEKP
jgi:hypothetical protein